ncbi:MAG: trypsin-like peptidase domain-containing protein [Anaerolineales bacterium]|nr:trypsin-like peptidase domain-containing protein [Anaerolineales bacterium]
MNGELKKFSEDLAEAAALAGKSVVTVKSRRRLPASGIALDAETILTAAHVIEDEENIRVVLADGNQQPANLVGYDPNSDLAVLALENGGAQPAAIAAEVKVGELVLALGRPSGDLQASLGTLSAKGGPGHHRGGGMLEGHYRTDATPFPGFSGGPLVNVSGQVVGINTSGLWHGKSIAIPMPIALKIAELLKKDGTIKRGYLGITGQPVELPEGSAAGLGRDQTQGLLIVGIEKDSPAAASGLLIGDILVGLAGEPIENHNQLLNALTGELVGQQSELEVLRGGKPETLKVTVGERPDYHDDPHRPRHWRGQRMVRFRRGDWHEGRGAHAPGRHRRSHEHHERHHDGEKDE